jgi:outer membrane protein TolC
VADAELSLSGRPAERKAALEAYVRRARNAERVVRAGHKAGVIPLAEVLEAEFFRADAEALLAEEEARQADGG